jgi:chemotaxis family two-component system response regulator Rcp1
MPGQPIEILLVEDNPGDIRLAQETLKEYKMQNKLHIVGDGLDALSFLRKQGPYRDVAAPDLVLMDLNLPRMDGAEVMAEMRKDPALKDLPVVVLAASAHDRALLKDIDIPTDCFVVKPLTLERFLEAVRCFEHLGLSIVSLASA